MEDNEEVVHEIEVSLGSPDIFKSQSEEDDPFSVSGMDIKDFVGLDRVFKQKTSRRISKAYTGADGAKSKQIEDTELTGYDIFEVVLPPYNMKYLAKIYEASSAHHAAVNAKTANIVGLGYDFEISNVAKRKIENASSESAAEKRRRRLAEERDKWVDWLENCNAEDDFLETLRKVWVDYETTGNGYIEIGRSGLGMVNYVGHIPSSTMRVRRLRDGFVQIVENKAVFFRNFGDRKTPNPVGSDNKPNEIIHLKKYSPTNGYYGVPNIISALNAIAGDEFASRYNLDYFENKAVPRYIIIVKGATLKDQSERQLHEFFKTGLKGKNHRSLYIPLPADSSDNKVDFKIEPVEASVQDSSFTNYRKANLNEILMAHRVPINKVSTGDGLSLANARDADKTFKEQVCRPEQRILENKLSKIIKEITDLFYLKLNELELSDEDTLSKIDERYLRSKVIVPNEVRARMKLPGIEGGDKPIELKPQQAADQRASASQSRERDRQRSNNAPDSDGEGRSTQGEGRSAA